VDTLSRTSSSSHRAVAAVRHHYVRGIRADLDERVSEIRSAQIQLGIRKLCPACRLVKTVDQFMDYGDVVCTDCMVDPFIDVDRYEPVSFIPG
jgi:hypothetical protein